MYSYRENQTDADQQGSVSLVTRIEASKPITRIPGWLVPEYKFHECCNLHDECWEDCDIDIKVCNDDFNACMMERCQTTTQAQLVPRSQSIAARKSCDKVARLYHKASDNHLSRLWRKITC